MKPELAEDVAQVFRTALLSRAVQDVIASQGNELSGAGPKEYAAIVASDYKRWGDVIKHIGLSLD